MSAVKPTSNAASVGAEALIRSLSNSQRVVHASVHGHAQAIIVRQPQREVGQR